MDNQYTVWGEVKPRAWNSMDALPKQGELPRAPGKIIAMRPG